MHLDKSTLAVAVIALLPWLTACNEFRIVPSCNDGIKNGAEGDTDCGGDACPRCALGRACGEQADCTAGSCRGGFCTPPEVGVWRQRDSGSRPERRFMHAMSFDGTTTLLFGGSDTIVHFGDTWHWDGTTWSKLSPAQAPSPRANASLVYDAAKQLTVLFGGVDFGGNPIDQTWSWNGMDWAQASQTQGPIPRVAPSTAFDLTRGEFVLYGGFANNADLGDTWTRKDGVWQMLSTPAPMSRHGAVMVYDEARKQAALFGGGIGASTPMPLNDTWTWDGTAWASATPAGGAAQSPPSRHSAAMAYNQARRRVILFGGNQQGNSLDDTWEWDGTAWSKPSGNSPPPRRLTAMTYDPQRRRVVLFGGTDGVGFYDDTWEYHQIGNPCQSDDACDTAHCVDGLCCESDKCNGCEACNVPSSPGRCTPCGTACTAADGGACGP